MLKHKWKLLELKHLLFFAIFVSPMGANALSFRFGSFQMTMFRLMIVILLVVSLVNHKLKVTVKKNYYTAFLLFWLLYAVFSIAWAIELIAWFKAVFFLFIAFTVLILSDDIFQSPKDIYGAFRAFFAGAALQSFIGWYEVFTMDYRFYDPTKVDYVVQYYQHFGVRFPIAMLGNPNDFSTLMLIGFFIGISFFLLTDKKVWKVVYLGLSISFAALIFFAESRANIIGLLLGIGILVFCLNHKKSFVVIAIIGIACMFPQTWTLLEKMLKFKFTSDTGSDIVRVGLMKTGFDYFLKTYGFGVGAGQFEGWVQRYGSPYYIGEILNLHNWWMEILTDYGLIVFVGYLIYYIKLFLGHFMYARKSENQQIKIVSVACCTALFGLTIALISASSNFSNEWFWMFSALCVSSYEFCADDYQKKINYIRRTQLFKG